MIVMITIPTLIDGLNEMVVETNIYIRVSDSNICAVEKLKSAHVLKYIFP